MSKNESSEPNSTPNLGGLAGDFSFLQPLVESPFGKVFVFKIPAVLLLSPPLPPSSAHLLYLQGSKWRMLLCALI